MGRTKNSKALTAETHELVERLLAYQPRLQQKKIADLLDISQSTVSIIKRSASRTDFNQNELESELDQITKAPENQIPVERLSNRAATTVEKRSFFSRMFKRGEA